MESKTTTVVIAAIVFALAGTMVFAAVAPYLTTQVILCLVKSH